MRDDFLKSKGLDKVIAGISGADFFLFFCAACESRLRVRLVGQESAVPVFEAVCAACGAKHRFKAIISDIPKKETVAKTGEAHERDAKKNNAAP